MNAVNKAVGKLQKELKKQISIIFPAAAVVLWQQFGWRKVRIMRRFATAQEIAHECGRYGPAKSMLQMLEDETGIELQLEGYQSYHDFQYLDSEKWDGKGLTRPQMIAMYGKMAKWTAPQLLAGLCLALYRDEGFSTVRLGRFIQGVDALRKGLGENPDAYRKMLEETTDIDPKDLMF